MQGKDRVRWLSRGGRGLAHGLTALGIACLMIGCAAQSPLTQKLVDPNPDVVTKAKIDFVKMGPDAVPPLARAAESENHALRIQAIMTLGTVGRNAPAAAPEATRALANILMDQAACIQRDTASKADLKTREAMLSADRELRDYAATALREIGLAALPTMAQIAAANSVQFAASGTATPGVEVVAAMMAIDKRHATAQFIDMLRTGKGSQSNVMNILSLMTKQTFTTVPEWQKWWQTEGYIEGVDLTK